MAKFYGQEKESLDKILNIQYEKTLKKPDKD